MATATATATGPEESGTGTATTIPATAMPAPTETPAATMAACRRAILALTRPVIPATATTATRAIRAMRVDHLLRHRHRHRLQPPVRRRLHRRRTCRRAIPVLAAMA